MFPRRVLALLVVLVLVASGTCRDGFNIYKDLLRGKGDEDDISSELIEPGSPRVAYFYRTPAQLRSAEGLSLSRAAQAALPKRTLDRFKNYMLGKESQGMEEIRKRSADDLNLMVIRDNEQKRSLSAGNPSR